MNEAEIMEDTTKTMSKVVSEGLKYESIYGLLVYQKENGLGLGYKIAALRNLFENDFNFMVTTFPIPNDGGK